MDKLLMESVLKKMLCNIVNNEETNSEKLQALYDLGLEDGDIRELGFGYILNTTKAVKEPKLQGVKTLKELLPLNLETDVWDNFTDTLGITLVGPTLLTEQGEAKFSDILDLPVSFEIDIHGNIVTTVNLTLPEDVGYEWKQRLKTLRNLLMSAAGCCSEVTYDKLFKEA